MRLLQTLSTLPNALLLRVNETPWTRAFIITTILQAGCIIILESLVLNANVGEINQLSYLKNAYSDSSLTVDLPGVGVANMTQAIAPVLDRFDRLKSENIFFMVFQAFQLWFTIDGLFHHNTIQLIASTIINFFCVVFGIIQIFESKKWLSRIEDIIYSFNIKYMQPFEQVEQVEQIEITLTIVMVAFSLSQVFIAYKVYRQYGWIIYKRIGANVDMQCYFKTYQIFVMLMKLNIFFELGFSIYFLFGILSNRVAIQPIIIFSPGLVIFHAIITGLIVPMLFLAYNALRSEHHYLMWIFIAFCLASIGDFVYIFGHSLVPVLDDNWIFWVFLIFVSIILAIITTIYGFSVMGNFGKGLKTYIARPVSLQTQGAGLQEVQNVRPRWAIEDDFTSNEDLA